MEEYQNIKVKDNCTIGAGYNSCVDVNFRAVDLFNSLGDYIKGLEKESGPIKPQLHERLDTFRQFLETFLYQFTNGANAERVCGTKELFDFVSEAVDKLNPRKEIGGHSPVWILRS